MSEIAWRRKRYYDPRIIIGTADVLECTFPDALVCITGAQRNLLQNVIGYLERRITYASEFHETYYLTPTEEEWDTLQEIVADLEDNIMNCETFTAQLQDILDAAQCACNSGKLSTSLGPVPGQGEPGEDVFDYGSALPDGDVSPIEAACCAVAQLWYQFGYELITEQVLPATRFGFDWLVPAAAAAIALMVGGPGAAIGVYALAELVQELLEILYDGAETNLVNWMESNKQELVCAMYGELNDGGNASAQWAGVYAAIVGPAEGISAGDKAILNIFMGAPACLDANAAYDAATTWALANVEPGYCDECAQPPIEGDGWFATWVNGDVYYCEILKSAPPLPEVDSIAVPKLTTRPVVGVLWEVTQAALDGTIDGREGGDCTSANNLFTAVHNARDTVGTQLSIVAGKGYQAAVEAALASGITQTGNVQTIVAAQDSCCTTWKCNGGHTYSYIIRVRWLVYEGQIP